MMFSRTSDGQKPTAAEPLQPGGVPWVSGVAVVAVLAFVYAPVVRVLVSQWAHNDTYSFGAVVPFISAFFVARQWPRLRRLRLAPSLVAGTVMVTGAAALLILGRIGAIVAFQELSLVGMIAGLVTLFLGLTWTRALGFPLAYLLLMLPVWEVVTDPLHYRAQLFSAWLGGTLLSQVGVPVHREGVYLQLPDLTLEVASVCSGINFLLAVVAIGIPAAYVFLRGWIPRLTVVLFSLGVAFVSNGVRVALIGLLAYWHVGGALHGPGHILQGLFSSTLGFTAVFGSVWVLSRWYPARPSAIPAVDLAAPPHGRQVASAGGLALSIALLLAVGPTALAGPPAPDSTTPTTPVELGAVWRQGSRASEACVGLPTSAARAMYTGPDGSQMQLLVAALTDRDADGALRYAAVGLPDEISATELALTLDGAQLAVNRAVYRHRGREVHVVYWYETGGRPTAKGWTAKMRAIGRLWTGGASPRLVVACTERPAGELTHPLPLTRFAIEVSRAFSRERLTRGAAS